MGTKMKQESVAVAWCDNGMVDGKFMQGVTDVILKSGVKFDETLRCGGNQIARQREILINYWYDKTDCEWLLWVDSDVVISPESFIKLWNHKDRYQRPMMTGVYFTSHNPEEPLMVPLPTLFNFADTEDGSIVLDRIHPLPKNKLMKVDAAGMGYILMHRSIVKKIREELPDTQFFQEMGKGTKFIGEDIWFFALCEKVGIPLWCDTSVTAPHMKRFSFDEHYYNAMTKGRK
jgi:hypothetical protein